MKVLCSNRLVEGATWGARPTLYPFTLTFSVLRFDILLLSLALFKKTLQFSALVNFGVLSP